MSAIVGLLVGLLWLTVFTAVLSVPLALFLRLACSLLGEKSPSFRQAMRIGAMCCWIQVVPLLAMYRVLPKSLVLWALWSGLLVALVYTKTLGLRYSRAVVVAVVQVLVVVVGVAAIGGVLNFAFWMDPRSPLGLRWL